MCAILKLVSAPSNPRPILDHFRMSHPLCEHSYWTNWTAHERKTKLKTVKWNCVWRNKTKQWLQHARKTENKKKVKTHMSIIKINNVCARTLIIWNIKTYVSAAFKELFLDQFGLEKGTIFAFENLRTMKGFLKFCSDISVVDCRFQSKSEIRANVGCS